MNKRTLADIVSSSLDTRKTGQIKGSKNPDGIAVEIPSLPLKSKPKAVKRPRQKPAFDINSILGTIFRSQGMVEEKTAEKGEKTEVSEARAIEEKEESHGGYGTSRRSSYGAALPSGYANYDKLYSHLGSFRAKGMYDDLSPSQITNKALDEGGKFFFLDMEVIDTGMRQLKYLSSLHKLTGEISAVPMGGVNSKDWEMLKLWSKIDPVMYQLKMNTL